MSEICTKALKNPKAILDRLEEYNEKLGDLIEFDPEEKELLSKAMRDSQTYKMVKSPHKKMDRITWSIISNMDLYKYYVDAD